MARRIAMALAALVVLGGAWIFLQGREDRGWEDVGYAFPEVTDVERVEILSAGGELVLEKQDGVWRMVRPVDSRVEQDRVSELVELFAEPPVIDLSRPPEEGGRVGLGPEDEATTLRYLGADDRALLAVRVGSTVEVERTRRALTWLAPEGAPGLYRVGLDVRSLTDREVDAWRDRRVSTLASTEVERLELVGEETVVVVRQEGEWRFEEEDAGEEQPDRSRVMSVVRALSTVRATGFLDEETWTSAGLEEPRALARLTTADGTTVELRLGRALDGEEEAADAEEAGDGEAAEQAVPDRWTFGLAGERQVYEVSRQVAERMLTGRSGLVAEPEDDEG